MRRPPKEKMPHARYLPLYDKRGRYLGSVARWTDGTVSVSVGRLYLSVKLK